MARSKSRTPILPQRRPHRKVSRDQKIALISKYVRGFDPTNSRSVDKLYKKYRSFPLDLLKKANKQERAELKKRGFFVTDKGVIVDGPRDSHRKPIKARRFNVAGNGIVKWTVNGRRDYIIGFTRQEKIEFARDPDGFVQRKIAELKSQFPDVRNARDIQVRLQWGAYQSTKDFSPLLFRKRYPYIENKSAKASAVKDRLTGLHVVVHVAKPRNKKRAKK